MKFITVLQAAALALLAIAGAQAAGSDQPQLSAPPSVSQADL